MTNETEKGSFSPKNEEKFQKNYVTKVLKFRSTLIINTCHKDKAKQFFFDFTLKNLRQRHNLSRFGSGSVSFCLPNHYGGASQQ